MLLKELLKLHEARRDEDGEDMDDPGYAMGKMIDRETGHGKEDESKHGGEHEECEVEIYFVDDYKSSTSEIKKKLKEYKGDLEFTNITVDDEQDYSFVCNVTAVDTSAEHDEDSIRNEVQTVIKKIFGANNIDEVNASY